MVELDVESTTLAQRVVLLGVTQLSVRGATPTHSGEVRRACTERLADVQGDVLGEVDEADVMRALNALEGRGLVDEVEVEDTSPVGKGRPTYALNVDAETVLDSFAADERIAGVVERIRDSQ